MPDGRRPRRWLSPSLGVRLAGLVAGVSLAVFAALVWMGLRTDERELVNEVIRGAALFSDTIRRSTYHSMLEDRRADAYRAMEIVGGEPGVEKVRIFNKEGRITFSTDLKEIGTAVDTQAESCYACHASGQPLVRLSVPSRSRIYSSPKGHRILGMVSPIYNEEACQSAACHVHPQEQRVLGVVDIGLSLQGIDADLSRLRRAKTWTAGLALLVLGALVLVFARVFVLRPVRELVRGTREVAAGALDHVIPVRSDDELGRLAESFNAMTAELKRARAELHALAAGLERQVEERTHALKDAQAAMIQSEKMISLGKLAASIAHEINNPLAGILTIAKLVVRTLESGPPTEKDLPAMRRQLSLVERETERCATIVRNLLAFARQRPLSPAEIDANAPLEEALSLASHRAQMQSVRIERHLAGPLPVEADFGQLRQACLNLIINAIEAMPSGGGLTVSSRALDDGGAELSVSDTGPGIPADLMDRVLDPFFTTKEKGTGLGLSVVYGIVERHGGKLELSNPPEGGARVVVRLPRRRAPEAPPAPGSEAA